MVEIQQGSAKRLRSLSGIKSTGVPHLGNYLGMMRPAIQLQDSHDAYYFIADYHALTTLHNAATMQHLTLEVAAYFLAFGLNPEQATIFRQSDVPQVTELSWILSCITPMGVLNRGHAYKAARDRHEGDSVVHGLFAYPVLMAADILLYDSDIIPVGKDQSQHIEIARDIAQRFNSSFNSEIFRLPHKQICEEVDIIPGLDGRKMSKSHHNTIEALSPPETLKKQVMKILTDSKTFEESKNPTTCNIFKLYQQFSTLEQQTELAEKYRAGNYGYGHAKLELFEQVNAHMLPFRERYMEIKKDSDILEDILQDGAKKASLVADEVLSRVRECCGYMARSTKTRQG